MSINTKKTNLRMLLRHNWLLWIVGIFLFAYGVWINIQWFSAQPSPILYLVNLLPGILLLLVWHLASQNFNKRWAIIAFGVLVTAIVSVFAIYMNIFAGIVLAATTPNTDVADYLHVREQIGNSELIRHFPPTIPDNATNVKFAYFGGFMQSGAYIRLRLQLPRDEIAKLSKEYHSKAKYMFIGGNKSDHANEPNGVPTTNFYTGDTEDGSFPENYETLVLNAKPGGTSDFKWNHGQSYGVVISLENSEIIYWAEDW